MRIIYNYFLSKYRSRDFTTFSHAKLILNFCLVSSLFSLFYLVVANLIDFQIAIIIMPILAVLFIVIALLLRSDLSLNLISGLYLVPIYVSAVWMIYLSGMIYSSIIPWLSFLPLSANLLINKKSAIVWLVICCSTVFAFSYLQDTTNNMPAIYDKTHELVIKAIVFNGLTGIILIISMIFQKANDNVLMTLKEKNDLISSINMELKKRHDEIIIQNKELRHQKDEISAQREFIHIKNKDLLIAQDELNDLIEKLTLTQQKLSDREAENRSILEAIYKTELLVGELGLNGNFTRISQSVLDYFQRPEQEIPEMTFNDIWGNLSHNKEIDVDELWESLKTGASSSHETSIVINEKEHWLKENFFPIRDKQGKTEKVMIISQDITQLKQQQNKIKTLNKDLKKHIKKIEKQNELLLMQQKEIEMINSELKQSNKEINYVNQNLEAIVVERTKHISKKNEQLSEYAYINAHLLRGPLCSILGLVSLLEKNSKQLESPILLHLKKSSRELKEVIDKISKAIELGTEFDRKQVS